MKSIKKLTTVAKNKFRHTFGHAEVTSQEIDEFKLGMEKICDMRVRYEGLIKASSTISRRACQFAAASRELADYFTEAFGTIDHSEIAAVFTRVGHVQQEVSELLEKFVSDVGATLISPTEDLLSELKQVESAKKEYDDKKMVHDLHLARVMKQKMNRYANGNVNVAVQDKELQQAKEDYDDFTMEFGCRMTALEQKKPRSLISQAMKYHNAQLKFFSNGMMTVQSIEPFMRQTAQQNHMDHGAMSPADPCKAVRTISDDDDLGSSIDMDRPIKALPAELPPQWNAVLSGLDKSLREMGADSLDDKDAVFAMNAMVMAALESGRVPPGRYLNTNRQSCRPSSTSVTCGASKSAPLTSAGLPVNMDMALAERTFIKERSHRSRSQSKSGPLLLSPLHTDRQCEHNSANIAICDKAPSSQTVQSREAPTANGGKRVTQGCLPVGTLPRKGSCRKSGAVSKSGPLPSTARGSGNTQQLVPSLPTQTVVTSHSSISDIRGPKSVALADRLPLQQQKAQHLQSQWNQQQPLNMLTSGKSVQKKPILSKSGPLVSSGAKARTGNMTVTTQAGVNVNGFPFRSGDNSAVSATRNVDGGIADALNLIEPLPASQGIPHSCPVLTTCSHQVRFCLDTGAGVGTVKSGPLRTRPPGRVSNSPSVSPISSPPSGLSPRAGEVHQLPPPPLNCSDKTSSCLPPSSHSGSLYPPSVLHQVIPQSGALTPPPLNCSDKSSSLPTSTHSGVLHPPSVLHQAIPQSGALLSTSPGSGPPTVSVSASTSASPLPPPPLHSLRSISPISTTSSSRNKVPNSKIGKSGLLVDPSESLLQPSSPTSTCSSTVTSLGPGCASVSSGLRDPGAANQHSPAINGGIATSGVLSSACLQNPKFKRSLSFNQTVSYSSGGLVDGGLKDSVASHTVTSSHTVRRPLVPLGSPPPCKSVSSPLAALPPPTPPEMPESQNALNALGYKDKARLLEHMSAADFEWQWVDDNQESGISMVPDWDLLPESKKEGLLHTLAHAVIIRREGFLDESRSFPDGTFVDYNDDHYDQDFYLDD